MTAGFIQVDPPGILGRAMTQSFAEMFLTPAAAAGVDRAHYTPFLIAAFRIDWLLFGDWWRGYNLHVALSFGALGCAALFFLHSGGRRGRSAWIAAAALLVAPPVLATAWYVAARHYIDGAALALVALGLFVRWSRGEGRTWMPWCAGLTYLLACLCKESYVPLPAIMLILAPDMRGRKAAAVIGAIAGGVYFLLRHAMLGMWVGGYKHGEYRAATLVREIVDSFPHVASQLLYARVPADPAWRTAAVITVLALVAALAALAWRSARAWGVCAVAAVLAAASISAVFVAADIRLMGGALESRLVCSLSIAAILSLAWMGIPAWKRAGHLTRHAVPVAVAMLAMAFFVINRQTVATMRHMRKTEMQAFRFFREQWRDDVLIASHLDTKHRAECIRLLTLLEGPGRLRFFESRRMSDGIPPEPRPFFQCAFGAPPRLVTDPEMFAATRLLGARLTSGRMARPAGGDLYAAFTIDASRGIRWRLTPTEVEWHIQLFRSGPGGTWHAVEAFPLAPTGSVTLPPSLGEAFGAVLAYVPRGGDTIHYTPILTIPLTVPANRPSVRLTYDGTGRSVSRGE